MSHSLQICQKPDREECHWLDFPLTSRDLRKSAWQQQSIPAKGLLCDWFHLLPVGIDGQLLIIPRGGFGSNTVFLFDRSDTNEPYRRLTDAPPLGNAQWEDYARRVSEPVFDDSTELQFMVCDSEENTAVYMCTYHKLKQELDWSEVVDYLETSVIFGQLAVCGDRLLVFEKDNIEGYDLESQVNFEVEETSALRKALFGGNRGESVIIEHNSVDCGVEIAEELFAIVEVDNAEKDPVTDGYLPQQLEVVEIEHTPIGIDVEAWEKAGFPENGDEWNIPTTSAFEFTRIRDCNAPSFRSHFGMSSLSFCDHILLFEGDSTHDADYNSVFVFSKRRRRWDSRRWKLPTRFAYSSAVLNAGTVHVLCEIGGLHRHLSLSIGHLWNVRAQTWHLLVDEFASLLLDELWKVVFAFADTFPIVCAFEKPWLAAVRSNQRWYLWKQFRAGAEAQNPSPISTSHNLGFMQKLFDFMDDGPMSVHLPKPWVNSARVLKLQ